MAIVDSSSSRIPASSSSPPPSDVTDQHPPAKQVDDQNPNLGQNSTSDRIPELGKNPNSDQNTVPKEEEDQKKTPAIGGMNLGREYGAEAPNHKIPSDDFGAGNPRSGFVSENLPNYGSGSSSGGSLSSEGGQENENQENENQENENQENEKSENGFHNHNHHHHHGPTMQELAELFSKLNPHAKEFVPPSNHADSEEISSENVNKANNNRKKKNGYGTKKRTANSRLQRAQWDDSIRRTVYVSDIDHQVTEEQLAALFLSCGQVVDCRVCGDPNSVLRFAFVEFTDEDGARRALSLAGTMLGFYPVRVLPSKTAIIPVNPTFLPQSEDEREMCARTIYCTNIDKKISQAEVKLYFEATCGKVARIRLLGDHRHSTRIAFVEFVMAESAIGALNCSGAMLGTLPIRVSPSKTPVRSCMARPFFM